MEIHAMRMGPGKHLKGRTLMGGVVKPEEVRFTYSTLYTISTQHGVIVRLLP